MQREVAFTAACSGKVIITVAVGERVLSITCPTETGMVSKHTNKLERWLDFSCFCGCLILRVGGSLLLKEEERRKMFFRATWYLLAVMSRNAACCCWSGGQHGPSC